MARGKKPARIATKNKVSRKRMLGEQQVFPIRCVSRREGMKYDILGGYVRLGRDGTETIYDDKGHPVPFRSIGKLVG